ncbi:MAG TPA: maleylpyruvate isomerase family mycothiol-dependent enzyme [Acidimicrobiia bacterium]
MPSVERGTIRSEALRILEIADRSLEHPVPQYPGWSMTDLLSHLAWVHGRTTIICIDLAHERVSGPRMPMHSDVSRWFSETLESMLEALASTDHDAKVWGFGSETTVGWWQRRMLIETGVHRWDAEQAWGEEQPLLDAVAAAGLEEYPDMWLPRLDGVRPLRLIATDLDRSWVYGEGDPMARVEGTGSDLYLRLMSRPGVDLPDEWAAAVDALEPPPKR